MKTNLVKSLFLSGLITGTTIAPVRAAYIEWASWKVYSSENFPEGRRNMNYPLTYLFDDAPATAWVFQGKGRPWDTLDKELNGAPFALVLVPKKPVVLDSLCLMNGYNRSPSVFQRNNRVTQIRLTVVAASGNTTRTVTLSDKMGWHSVALPHQAITKLRIELTGFQRGRDNDVCLSEIALFNGSQKIAMHMPEAVVYSDGEGEQYLPSDLLINRQGKLLARADMEETQWSPSGRYVLGIEGTQSLWLADAHNATILVRPQGSWETAAWKSDYVAEVKDRQGRKTEIQLPSAKERIGKRRQHQ